MAKAFNFSLQKVLDMRKHFEDQKAIELSKAQKELNEEKTRLKLLRDRKEEALRSKEIQDKVSLNGLKVMKGYIAQINDNILHQNRQVKKSDQKVFEHREKLVEAVKDKKMVETLKDRHREEYRRMKNLTETKTIDEVALRVTQKTKDEEKGKGA